MESSKLIHYLFIYLFIQQTSAEAALVYYYYATPSLSFFSFSFFEVQIFQKIYHIIYFFENSLQ